MFVLCFKMDAHYAAAHAHYAAIAAAHSADGHSAVAPTPAVTATADVEQTTAVPAAVAAIVVRYARPRKNGEILCRDVPLSFVMAGYPAPGFHQVRARFERHPGIVVDLTDHRGRVRVYSTRAQLSTLCAREADYIADGYDPTTNDADDDGVPVDKGTAHHVRRRRVLSGSLSASYFTRGIPTPRVDRKRKR
jgi:hypothetical protein